MPKVYDLGFTNPEKKPQLAKRLTPTQAPDSTRPAPHRGSPAKRAFAAYLAGPIAAAFMTSGSRQVVWAAVALLFVGACIMTVAAGSSISDWLAARSNGILLWLTIVPAIVFAFGTAWMLAIAEATRGHVPDLSYYPRWLRRFASVLACGIVIPGLGLRFAGHPWRAAFAFWVTAPLAASLVVLIRGEWLWETSRSAALPGVSSTTVELALMIAAGVAVGTLLWWLVQALDGARLASNRHSPMTNIASVALMIALALGALTFRPTTIARGLNDGATALEMDGFALVPLAFCEAAAWIDPATPRYIAHAADLNEALGMMDEAEEKRRRIAKRMKEYEGVLRRLQGPPPVMVSTPYVDPRYPRALDVEH